MKDGIVVKRYALALFRLARESNKIDEAKSSLEDIRTAFEKNRVFFLWLESLSVPNRRRVETAEKIFRAAGVPDIVVNTVSLLIARERISIFEEVQRRFNGLVDASKGTLRGSLFAADIGAASYVKEKLTEKLAARFKKVVVLDSVKKEGLIGGVMLKIKDSVWDASVKRRLTEIKESLCQ